MDADSQQSAVFGAVDGLVMVLGIVAGLLVAHQGHLAAWHAALGGAAGEMVGMTIGKHLAGGPGSSWPVSITCGLAGGAACLAPAVPFATASGTVAIVSALLIAAGVGAAICWLRPERGMQAIVRTYGLLLGAGVLAGLTGLI